MMTDSLDKKSIPQNWYGAIMNIYHESDVKAAVLKLKDEVEHLSILDGMAPSSDYGYLVRRTKEELNKVLDKIFGTLANADGG